MARVVREELSMAKFAGWICGLGIAVALAGCSQKPKIAPPPPAADVDWGFYGGAAGGQRFSPAAQITPAHVKALAGAWAYSAGDIASNGGAMQRTAFAAKPIMIQGR